MSVNNSEVEPGQLFVWRDWFSIEDFAAPLGHNIDGTKTDFWQKYGRFLYKEYLKRCPFCSGQYSATDSSVSGGGGEETLQISVCICCGFEHRYRYGNGIQDTWSQRNLALLRKLNINSAELGLEELGTHLRRRYSDRFYLSPRRFEELVANIFKYQGYHTRLTKQTRDGGYDVVLMEASSGDQIIIECKRYSAHRKVGIGAVHRLLGVQFIKEFKAAKLVTTSSFSRPALQESEIMKSHPGRLQFELVDAHELLHELGVYNERLPPLYNLNLPASHQ